MGVDVRISRWCSNVAAAGAVLILACGGSPANARGADTVPPPEVSPSSPHQPLSDKLNETGGVLHPKSAHDREAIVTPPRGIDPEIKVPPPARVAPPATK